MRRFIKTKEEQKRYDALIATARLKDEGEIYNLYEGQNCRGMIFELLILLVVKNVVPIEDALDIWRRG